MTHKSEFERDKDSKALINTNKQAFEDYKRLKSRLKKTSELESEINSLKHEFQEIKKLLKSIADRID